MVNTIFTDLTTKASFGATEVPCSIHLGDSIISGTDDAPLSGMIDPDGIYPDTLAASHYWTKFGDGAGSTSRLTLSDGSFTFAATRKAGGNVTGALTYACSYYGCGLFFGGNGSTEFTPYVTKTEAIKHYQIVCGISGSVLNDNLTALPTALAHWDPDVASGAFTLATEHYIQPAFANLQASKTIFLDAVYIHCGNDASSAFFSSSDASKYGIHLSRFISRLEQFLEFPGVPIVIIQTPQLSDSFGFAGTIRAAQARVAASRPRTYLLNTSGYAQGPSFIHFDAMSSIKMGYDAAALVRSKLGDDYAAITKAF